MFEAKVVVVGDETVGKTSLVGRFVQNTFKEIYKVTVGVDISHKIVRVDGKELKINLWDIAGQSLYKNVRGKFYKEADAMIFVFDLTRRKTLDNLPFWLQELFEHSGREYIPLVVIGNKADLSSLRDIPEEEIINLVLENPEVPYIMASAKTGKGVEDAFKELGRLLVDTD